MWKRCGEAGRGLACYAYMWPGVDVVVELFVRGRVESALWKGEEGWGKFFVLTVREHNLDRGCLTVLLPLDPGPRSFSIAWVVCAVQENVLPCFSSLIRVIRSNSSLSGAATIAMYA